MWLCKRDLSKECEGYRDCTDCVLDKVRVEIIHEFNNHKKGMTVYDIVQIIKKYKTESEEEI